MSELTDNRYAPPKDSKERSEESDGTAKYQAGRDRWVRYRRTHHDASGSHWNAEAARQDDTGLRFWAYVTTGPLTLLTLANLLAAWKASGAARGWWLAAALVVLTDRILTFSYFIPTMVGLMNAADSPASVAMATQWVSLNYLRHALVFGGWLAALRAFSLLPRGHG